MSDYIERWAAILTVKKWADGYSYIEVPTDNAIADINNIPVAEATPHRNYQHLSAFWCECGWYLGKKGDVNYCANCGKKVKWSD